MSLWLEDRLAYVGPLQKGSPQRLHKDEFNLIVNAALVPFKGHWLMPYILL